MWLRLISIALAAMSSMAAVSVHAASAIGAADWPNASVDAAADRPERHHRHRQGHPPPEVRVQLGNYPELGRATAKAIPRAVLVKCPGASHAPQIQNPAAPQKAQLAWLTSPERGRTRRPGRCW